MPLDDWSEDDRPERPAARRWRWWHVAGLGFVVLVAVFGIASALLPERLAGGWIGIQVRRLRADVLAGRFTPEELREHLRTREGGKFLAVRLSEDDDPRVRSAAAVTFTNWGRPAQKREVGDLRLTGNTFSETDIEEALRRLLNDPDPSVRKSAIRTVSSLEEVRSFADDLQRILESGPADERLIVAVHLAHWNGRTALRTFADPGQPKPVRLAAIEGAERYGWGEILRDPEAFVRTMRRVQGDPDADLSRAAASALERWGGPGKP
jgi:hypothetical protein